MFAPTKQRFCHHVFREFRSAELAHSDCEPTPTPFLARDWFTDVPRSAPCPGGDKGGGAYGGLSESRRHRRHRLFIQSLVALGAGIVLLGCTRVHSIIEVPCGAGKLLLQETYQPGVDHSPASFELFYLHAKQRRLVATIQHDTLGLFSDPRPEEHYHQFRGADEPDPSPVRVDANRFTVEEYHQIRHALAEHLEQVDAALLLRDGKKISLYDYRKPRISSIRYIQPDHYHRLYRGPQVVVIIEPEGRAIVAGPPVDDGRAKIDFNGEMFSPKGTMGVIIENGRTLVLPPLGPGVPGTTLVFPIPGFPDRSELARECRDKHGRILADDFNVVTAPDEAGYREAVRQHLRQRDKGRGNFP